jgi:hypothetical protein
MMIAGIVIASLACLFATIAVVLLCLARHKRQKQESATIDTIPMSQLSQSPNRPQYDAAPRSPTPMVGQYSSRVSDITASTLDSYGAVQTKHYSTMQMVDSNAYANGNVNVDI